MSGEGGIRTHEAHHLLALQASALDQTMRPLQQRIDIQRVLYHVSGVEPSSGSRADPDSDGPCPGGSPGIWMVLVSTRDPPLQEAVSGNVEPTAYPEGTQVIKKMLL